MQCNHCTVTAITFIPSRPLDQAKCDEELLKSSDALVAFLLPDTNDRFQDPKNGDLYIGENLICNTFGFP